MTATQPFGQERIGTLAQLGHLLERLQNGRLPFRRLVVAGPIATAIRLVTGTTTLVETDRTVLADATGGAFTVTLPAAADLVGVELVVKRINGGGNAVTLQGATAGETIDGAVSIALNSQYEIRRVQSDGLVWHVVA